MLILNFLKFYFINQQPIRYISNILVTKTQTEQCQSPSLALGQSGVHILSQDSTKNKCPPTDIKCNQLY